MIQNKRLLLVLSAAFALSEIALGILIQTADVGVRYFSYASVLLACTFCAMFFERSQSYLFTQLGLLCTVCADYFLVLTEPRRQLPAMLFFSVTQLAYFARLYASDQSNTRRKCHLSVRVGASVLAIGATLIVLREKTDAVALVSMFYYANLITNIVFSFLQTKITPLFSIGLLLFLLCDTLIGLSCMDAYITIPRDSFLWALLHPGFDLAWAFYVPSQTLIALSLLPDRLKKQK